MGTNIMDLLKTDIYPSLTENVEKLDCYPNFKELSTNCQIYPFIFYLDNNKIYYRKLPYDQKTLKHFSDVGKLKTTGARLYSWEDIDRRISISIHEEKKNTDVRTSFKFNLNNFLVKKLFTTGQRTVAPGTEHIFQLAQANMQFYYLVPREGVNVQIINRSFFKESQFAYNHKTMEALKSYRIPEGTVYLVNASQNCYFSLHIVQKDKELPFQCQNLIESSYTPPCVDPYVCPVPTPLIEDSHRKRPAASTFKIPKKPKLSPPVSSFRRSDLNRWVDPYYTRPVPTPSIETASSGRRPECTITSDAEPTFVHVVSSDVISEPCENSNGHVVSSDVISEPCENFAHGCPAASPVLPSAPFEMAFGAPSPVLPNANFGVPAASPVPVETPFLPPDDRFIQWYQQDKYKQYNDPRPPIHINQSNLMGKPLDLSVGISVIDPPDIPSAPAASPVLPSATFGAPNLMGNQQPLDLSVGISVIDPPDIPSAPMTAPAASPVLPSATFGAPAAVLPNAPMTAPAASPVLPNPANPVDTFMLSYFTDMGDILDF